MVITVLEAAVDPQNWSKLEAAYGEAVKTLDRGIVQTFLAQRRDDASVWQIITVWESMEALMSMRQSGETPKGIVMFNAAGAEPKLEVLAVANHAEKRV